jgi:signal transduction histidine kinase
MSRRARDPRDGRRRLRAGFALLAAALLVPAALLVQRALRGVAAEQEARHRAVAERVFDEMERALSELVAREEARPVAAWRADGDERLRALPEERFVLGYFQVEADGRLTTPLPARDAAALRAAAAWFAARDEGAPAAPAGPPPAQAPGTTVAEEQLRALGYAEADAGARAPAPAAEGAYEALQSLNRGASERRARARKLEAPSSDEAPALADDARREVAAAEPASPPTAGGSPPARAQAPRVAVAVDPLVGRLADERTLLLYRSVFTGRDALRQGLVLDVDRLGDWLRARGPGRVPGASLAFARVPGAQPEAPDTAGGYRYRHRFAEPFDAVSASLALAPLGGAAGPGALYALSALLLLTATAGLFALYRTAALAMAFAERRSNFVAAVTHELKTPVTAIRLYGEMLRDGLVPSEEKRREYFRTITAESERLGRLVDDVLELARLEQGARPVALRADALEPVVAEALELLRPQAERAGFRLRSAVEPGLPRVRFDRDALLQVLGNLVDNALKYARHADEREIEVRSRRAGRGVELAVRDHGPGVESRQLPLLFEPFHRGEDERVRTTRGTGLGLALVKRLVERMGGQVEGRNAPGGGFEVRIALEAEESPG